jgi:outer membrane protein OmpA-like peptidoglycan-associated protein
MKVKSLLIAVFLLATTPLLFAQDSGRYGLPKKKDFDKWSVGITGGLNWFQGDLNEKTGDNNSILKNIKDPVIGLKVGYQLSHSVQLNVRGNYTNLSGKKNRTTFRVPNPVTSPQITRDIKFKSPIYQGSFNINYTIGNISFLQRNKRLHFYGELGVGLFSFAPKVTDLNDGTVYVKKDPVTEGMIPISLGVKYQVKRFDIGLLYTFHKTLTDKVDQVYDAKTETDNWSFFQLGINYTFGKKQAMMEWVNPMEVVYNDLSDMKDRIDVMSGDKDKDGVSDLFDKDNSTPEGVHVYGDGTAIDSDGDGVPDHLDADPYSGKGAKVDANGLELDSDGDGVPDSKDLEPNTPKGNLVNFQGMTIAPAGSYGNDGITSNSATGWLPSIFFDVDQSVIKPAYHDRLNTVARVLIKNPKLKLSIVGNCDVDASEQYNDKLGLRRAEAAKDHLVKVYGIDASRLTVTSLGKKEQLAKGNKRMNRRVDFEVAK